MLLHNVYVPGLTSPQQIHIADQRIKTVQPVGESISVAGNELKLEFENVYAFPGLINSHDHLDFNLFPALGNRIYANYTEWGREIHQLYSSTIQQVLKIPLALRTQWGLYKNLLNGVTTVVNHGERLTIPNELITVFQDCFVLHSVQFEKNWKWKLNNPFGGGKPLNMHVGEGTDEAAHKEIDTLIRWNLFNKKMTGIHGVAMTAKQADRFEALVWCPESNYFLLNETANISALKKHTRIIFGTDSTLTASWNMWDHLRLAIQTNMMTDEELLDTLTATPAKVWGLEGQGRLSSGASASIVIAQKKTAQGGMRSFWEINPQDILLVMHQGEILLFDSRLLEQLSNAGFQYSGFSRISFEDIHKYVQGDLSVLVREIRQYYPEAAIPFSV